MPWVGLLELASARFMPISAFPNVYCVYAQGLGCVCSDPLGHFARGCGEAGGQLC
jgi:hypothetical protein